MRSADLSDGVPPGLALFEESPARPACGFARPRLSELLGDNSPATHVFSNPHSAAVIDARRLMFVHRVVRWHAVRGLTPYALASR